MGCGRNLESSSSSSSSSGHIKKKDRCICDVVRAIKDIQDQATDMDCPVCPTNCFLEPLGTSISPSRHQADTRVFMLLTKDGTPFKAFFRENERRHDRRDEHRDSRDSKDSKDGRKDDDECFSVFFRVEEVFDGCCATLRVLEPLDDRFRTVDLLNKDGDKLDLRKICKVEDFRLSNSCITVDLNCFCGIECVADVFLGVCD